MKEQEKLWMGVGVGCALLLLCSLCILAALFAFATKDAARREAERRNARPTLEQPDPLPSDPVPSDPLPSDPQPPTVALVEPEASEARTIHATLSQVSGLPLALGTTCTLRVTRHDRSNGTFVCHALVACGSLEVFGGGETGFFECVLYEGTARDVVGSDPSTTETDGDAAIGVNTVGGSVELWDDARGPRGAFRLTLHVDRVE